MFSVLLCLGQFWRSTIGQWVCKPSANDSERDVRTRLQQQESGAGELLSLPPTSQILFFILLSTLTCFLTAKKKWRHTGNTHMVSWWRGSWRVVIRRKGLNITQVSDKQLTLKKVYITTD